MAVLVVAAFFVFADFAHAQGADTTSAKYGRIIFFQYCIKFNGDRSAITSEVDKNMPSFGRRIPDLDVESDEDLQGVLLGGATRAWTFMTPESELVLLYFAKNGACGVEYISNNQIASVTEFNLVVNAIASSRKFDFRPKEPIPVDGRPGTIFLLYALPPTAPDTYVALVMEQTDSDTQNHVMTLGRPGFLADSDNEK